MTWILIAVGAVLGFMVLMLLKARSIARRHSITLSHITGIPADTIAREMTDGNLTPGQWVAQHGLEGPGAS